MSGYTDAQKVFAFDALVANGDVSAERAAQAVSLSDGLLTERQAGSSGDAKAWLCEKIRFKYDHNDVRTGDEVKESRIVEKNEDAVWLRDTFKWTITPLFPPQPPAKESVRGVTQHDVDQAIATIRSYWRNAVGNEVHLNDHGAMRAALESFANRGDGDE